MAWIDGIDDRKMACKLHRQFAHPNSRVLKRIVQNAGVKNKKLEKEIDLLAEKCITCLKFRKRPPRPVVSVAWATEFNEMIAIDLKFWGQNYFLVMVDLATRFCTACVITKKTPATIVKALFLSWIVTFGPPKKILSDNGGEFCNDEMKSLSEAFSIKLLTTAAESPWSNGTCERLNGVLGKLVLKILDDTNCDVPTALAWAVSARNSYYNFGGFSPNQLVFGKNPAMPDIFNSKLPGLNRLTSSEIVRRNLEAKKKANEEFIKFTDCEKFKKAMSNNVRDTSIEKIEIGDEVYYKRNVSDEWHGPARVILIDNKIATVRHGGATLRVHGVSLVKAPHASNEDTVMDSSSIHDGPDNSPNIISPSEKSENLQEGAKMDIDKVSEDTEKSVKRKRDHDDELPHSNKFQKVSNKMRIWKAGQRFQGIESASGEYISGKIISRAGKAGKSNSNIYNIERDQDGYFGWFDMNKIKDITPVTDDTEMTVLLTNSAVSAAQGTEYQSWLDNDVIKLVDDTGQKCISVRWVITQKVKDGRLITKARLVARGFEENTSGLQKDSPTCSREAIRILIAIASSKQWVCHTVDVKSAYLQGDKIQRDIYLRPPKEFDNGQIWKLNKTVYGLCDAARAWYLKIKNELNSMDVKVCPLDNSLFSWHKNGELEGIICIYVDDFLWTGSDLFHKNIITRLESKFSIGSSASVSFTYVGLSIKSYEDGLTIDQDQYIASLTPIPISKERFAEKNDSEKNKLKESEKKAYRALVGQLNWVATHTRPDVAFETCILSISFYESTIADLIRLNKLVERVKREKMNLFFPRLHSFKKCSLECYTDAAHKNLPNGKSQGGLIIFLQDEFGNKCPLYWRSKKLDRVVKSSLSAETQALVEGAEYAVCLASIIKMLFSDTRIKVNCYTDSKSLVDSLSSLKQQEPCFRQDTLVLKDMLERGVIEPLTWVRSQDQLADVLTKRGVCTGRIIKVLSRS